MPTRPSPRLVCRRLALGLLLTVSSPVWALNIVLDYTHDTFFAANATATAALEKAAADVSWAITTSLDPLSKDFYTYTHTVDADMTTYEFDFDLTYSNPETGTTVSVPTFNFAADEYRIYVGGRPLSGSTLGQGGIGGVSYSAGWSFLGFFDPDVQSALDGAAALVNAMMPRGGPAPNSDNVSDSGASATLFFGYTVGNLWFDTDTDNNGVLDDAALLAMNWHFDHTTEVESGKNDLYSVAVHEILHAVGYGASDQWDANLAGQNWTGSEVIDLYGTGTGLVDSGLAHVENGIMGTPIVDGVLLTGQMQEVVMDPDITVGSRKYLTDLDLAFLRDVGWETAVPVPEPSTWALALCGGAFVAWASRRRFSAR